MSHRAGRRSYCTSGTRGGRWVASAARAGGKRRGVMVIRIGGGGGGCGLGSFARAARAPGRRSRALMVGVASSKTVAVTGS